MENLGHYLMHFVDHLFSFDVECLAWQFLVIVQCGFNEECGRNRNNRVQVYFKRNEAADNFEELISFSKPIFQLFLDFSSECFWFLRLFFSPFSAHFCSFLLISGWNSHFEYVKICQFRIISTVEKKKFGNFNKNDRKFKKFQKSIE